MEYPAAIILAPFPYIGIQPARPAGTVVLGYHHIGKNLLCIVVIVSMVDTVMDMVDDCHIRVVIVPLLIQEIIGQLPFLPIGSYDHLFLKQEGACAQKDSDKDERKYEFIKGNTAAEYCDKLIVGIEISQSVSY